MTADKEFAKQRKTFFGCEPIALSFYCSLQKSLSKTPLPEENLVTIGFFARFGNERYNEMGMGWKIAEKGIIQNVDV